MYSNQDFSNIDLEIDTYSQSFNNHIRGKKNEYISLSLDVDVVKVMYTNTRITVIFFISVTLLHLIDNRTQSVAKLFNEIGNQNDFGT